MSVNNDILNTSAIDIAFMMQYLQNSSKIGLLKVRVEELIKNINKFNEKEKSIYSEIYFKTIEYYKFQEKPKEASKTKEKITQLTKELIAPRVHEFDSRTNMEIALRELESIILAMNCLPPETIDQNPEIEPNNMFSPLNFASPHLIHF